MLLMERIFELILAALLLATLLQAIRLERALGVLKRDRASLEALAQGFNASTHQAESGIQRLRAAADGAGRQIESQIAKSTDLKDDLAFLTEQGGRIAGRLEQAVRAADRLVPGSGQPPAGKPAQTALAAPSGYSKAELELLTALRMAR